MYFYEFGSMIFGEESKFNGYSIKMFLHKYSKLLYSWQESNKKLDNQIAQSVNPETI